MQGKHSTGDIFSGASHNLDFNLEVKPSDKIVKMHASILKRKLPMYLEWHEKLMELYHSHSKLKSICDIKK